MNRRGEVRISTAVGTTSLNPWSLKNGDIPFTERIGGEGEIQHQNWDGTSSSTTHDLGELKGVDFENYGQGPMFCLHQDFLMIFHWLQHLHLLKC